MVLGLVLFSGEIISLFVNREPFSHQKTLYKPLYDSNKYKVCTTACATTAKRLCYCSLYIQKILFDNESETQSNEIYAISNYDTVKL